MNENIVVTEPIIKHYEWNLKDASRNYWYIGAKYRGGIVSTSEEGFFQSVWNVSVHSHSGYTMEIVCETQYDSPIKIDDIVWDIHRGIMSMYNAALLERGRELWQKKDGETGCVAGYTVDAVGTVG